MPRVARRISAFWVGPCHCACDHLLRRRVARPFVATIADRFGGLALSALLSLTPRFVSTSDSMCKNTQDDSSPPSQTSEDAAEGILSQESADVDEQDSLAPAVDSEAPDEIANRYNLCIDYVHRALGMTLDFSDETLPILDHYVSIARETIRSRPEVAQLLYGAIGAYFGELVRRKVNGYWLIPNPDTHNWRVCARFVFLSLNPIGAACEAIAQGGEQDGPSGELRLAHEDRSIIAERLAMAPPVPQDQYYLLSTRLEAIDIAVEALRLAMQQGGHANIEFEIEDYEQFDH